MNKQNGNFQTRNTIERPLLSVVMPSYNPNKYLALCLDSILGQTFDDFEIIVIDDCSTDDSFDVLIEYANRDDRMIVLKNKSNVGAAKTRNRGLQLARGKYVVFLDADDLFETTYFEDAINTLEKNNADLCISPILILDMQKGKETPLLGFKTSQLVQNGVVFNVESYKEGLFQIVPVPPYNKVVNRELLLDSGLEFQNLENSNDVYWGLMILAVATKIVYLPKSYVHYRYNWPGQITAKRNKNPFCIVEACNAVKKELKRREKWKCCRASFYEYAVVNIAISVKIAPNPVETLNTVVKNVFPQLGLLNLNRQDFCSPRGYGLYRLFYTGESVLGNPKDILRCLCSLTKEREFSTARWVIGRCFAKVPDVIESKVKK